MQGKIANPSLAPEGEKSHSWAYEKMKEKGFANVEELEAEVNRLREIVGDPQIEPLILRDHTRENIRVLATYVQTEGSITAVHQRRSWTPEVELKMGVEEPVELTGKLVTEKARETDTAYIWLVTWDKAFSLLETIEPYLMADKWEAARYMLNIGKAIPDTEYRPMYYTIVKGKKRPVFLYPEYVDFPVKYAIVVHKGDVLPKPLDPKRTALKYTPDRRRILWHEGMVKE